MLKAHGLQARPISLFGIGILSSFMIADRLHVRTHPGGVNAERRPYDITISGPGSLFWLQEGTLAHQGTEVKLFLKPQYRLEHDAEGWLDLLRLHFGYREGELVKSQVDKHVIDPVLIAGMHVVWPLYPVMVEPPADPADPHRRAFPRRQVGVSAQEADLGKSAGMGLPSGPTSENPNGVVGTGRIRWETTLRVAEFGFGSRATTAPKLVLTSH